MKIYELGFKEGQELKISIKLSKDCTNFVVNIGHDSDNIALHFNPRFDYNPDDAGCRNIIACNSMSGGFWEEEQREENFAFSRGEECKLNFSFNNEKFHITLPDGSMMKFPNRPRELKYEYLNISGAEFKGLEMV
ncbi:galectin-2-like [Melanotaenia boesemani]|uniref:galectin-2-like n=1 Tax=Melanotaenia boesemani TaxID=1250792 RepID=UPI001C05E7FE|nr:galectin-2-like [Melanotaenia boesemani]XP_041838951.1 galectin-2-like [Melanotaenia boesemani]